MLKIKEIKEKLEDLNDDARNWKSMTPGGYSYITVNAEGHIDISVQSQGDIVEFNYDCCYPIIAPCKLDQVLKALDHWSIEYR